VNKKTINELLDIMIIKLSSIHSANLINSDKTNFIDHQIDEIYDIISQIKELRNEV
jgi:hypothetical protein